jgi:hypothetical protein
MFRQRFFALVTALAVIPQAAKADQHTASAGASPMAEAPTWEPKPITVDAQRLALANDWLARVAEGRIDRTQLDPQFSGIITDDVISGGVKFVGSYGRPEQLVPIEVRTNSEGVAIFYRARYSDTVLTWIVRTDSVGRINGMCLRHNAHNAIYRVVYENRMGTL